MRNCLETYIIKNQPHKKVISILLRCHTKKLFLHKLPHTSTGVDGIYSWSYSPRVAFIDTELMLVTWVRV